MFPMRKNLWLILRVGRFRDLHALRWLSIPHAECGTRVRGTEKSISASLFSPVSIWERFERFVIPEVYAPVQSAQPVPFLKATARMVRARSVDLWNQACNSASQSLRCQDHDYPMSGR